jgi:hypothetical protein
MRLRLTCDISQEQIDCGYDMTLLALHSRFIEWILGLELPITAFHITWEQMEDDDQHMFVSAELVKDASVNIDVKFFDEIRLGGNDNG